MSTPGDDDADALTWAGDDRLDRADAAPPLTVVVTPGERPSTPGIVVVTYGILVGVYVLLTAGWIASVLRSTTTLPTLFTEIMFQFGEFLAIASPALWFVTVLALTRGRRPIVRLLLLLAGIIVVPPWPFLLGV